MAQTLAGRAGNNSRAVNNSHAARSAQNFSVSDFPAVIHEDNPFGIPRFEQACLRTHVNMSSGAVQLKRTDGQLSGPMPFMWERYFHSGHEQQFGLGQGWSHSGSERIMENIYAVDYRDEQGRHCRLHRPDIGQTSVYATDGFSLEKIDNVTYILRQSQRWDKVFKRLGKSAIYRLTQYRHAHYQPENKGRAATGFAIDFIYNEKNQLVQVAGNWGLSFLIRRNELGLINRLDLRHKHSESEKTVINYDYDNHFNLICTKGSGSADESFSYEDGDLYCITNPNGYQHFFRWKTDKTLKQCIQSSAQDGMLNTYFEWDNASKTSRAIDSRGYTTRYHYNEYGLIDKEIDREGAEHLFTYQKGRLTSYTNPANHRTDYFYSEDYTPCGIRDPLGNSAVLSFFKGRLTAFKNKDNTRWKNEYDDRGRLTTHIDCTGQKETYRYSERGLLLSRSNPIGQSCAYAWSTEGYLLSVKESGGLETRFCYNIWGDITRIEHHDHTSGYTDPIQKIEYRYDQYGNLCELIVGGQVTSRQEYDCCGNVLAKEDGLGHRTEFEYNLAGKVTRFTDPSGNITEYHYDTEFNLIRIINPQGDQYRFTYDGNGRITEEIGFDGRSQQYQYNQAGKLINHLDSESVIHEYERDPLGQVLVKSSTQVKGGDQDVERMRFRYDNLGRIIECYNNHQYLQFVYNGLGNLVKEHSSRIENDKRTQASMRDITLNNVWPGLCSQVTLPDGKKIGYHYDKEQRLSHISFNNNVVTQFEYDVLGRETASLGLGVSTGTHYNAQGLIEEQNLIQRHSQQALASQKYTYDDGGNIKLIEQLSSSTQFSFNKTLQLTQIKNQRELNFSYSDDGFLLSKTQMASQDNPQVKAGRLYTQDDTDLEYDARGNITRIVNRDLNQSITLKYNLQNQLIESEKSGQVTRYFYDPMGRRIEKVGPDKTHRYLWLADQLIQETIEQKGQSESTTYFYRPQCIKPVAKESQEELFRFHLQPNGLPQAVTNASGETVWEMRFGAFGEMESSTLNNTHVPFRFAGQYYDDESGLHYNRHRYYSPKLGQFTCQDPCGLLGGLNLYQYAPNTIQWIDPLGLSYQPSQNIYPASSKPYCQLSLEPILQQKGYLNLFFDRRFSLNGAEFDCEYQQFGIVNKKSFSQYITREQFENSQAFPLWTIQS